MVRELDVLSRLIVLPRLNTMLSLVYLKEIQDAVGALRGVLGGALRGALPNSVVGKKPPDVQIMPVEIYHLSSEQSAKLLDCYINMSLTLAWLGGCVIF